MEKSVSYFDWQLSFRKTEISHSPRIIPHNEFNVMLKQLTETIDINKTVSLNEEDYDISDYATSSQAIKIIIHRLGKEPCFIFIDLAQKTITHDCGRSNELKTRHSLKFCHHLAKLFLILKEKDFDKALSLLRYIYRNRKAFILC